MENQKVSHIFQEIGDILELMGENRFRVLAYQRAAQTISTLNVDVRQIYDDDPKKFREIPGIGEDLSNKIIEMLETGRCKFHEQLMAGFSKGLLELLTLRGLGPKKVKKIYEALGVDSIQKLKQAAQKGQLAKLPGMGEKSQAEIVKAIADHEKHRERILLHTALTLAEGLIVYMKKAPGITEVQYAGSLRRGNETIGDIDILATGKNHAAIIAHFVAHPDVTDVLAQGDTKASVLIAGGVQADLRVVDPSSFGAALYYFTGSKEHNIHARKIAISKGWKINEYGLYRGNKQIAGRTEDEMFDKLGLPTIIPELREDQGEIEAGYSGELPHSLELEDIRGDLHLHTEASDGKDSLEAMIEAALERGYEYIAITDHSPAVGVANGLKEDRLLEHLKKIDALDKKLKGKMRVLKGAEVDIHADGTLDYPNALLKLLDVVNISVHSKFSLPAKEQTARVIKALSNPYVTILCHPTGRIVKQREPYDIDLVEVARAAAKHRVALEINGSMRLDLSPGNIRLAKEQGALFILNTDSHQIRHLGFMRFAVTMARRGWLEKKDVLNTRSLEKMMSYFRSRKHRVE